MDGAFGCVLTPNGFYYSAKGLYVFPSHGVDLPTLLGVTLFVSSADVDFCFLGCPFRHISI